MVKVYSTSSCPWCVRAKEYLKLKGIPFQDINVSADWDAAKEMVKKSGQRGVPVIEINDEIIVGFDKSRIDQLLQAAN